MLPFWRTHTPDLVNGGFVGTLTHDLQGRNDVPRSAVVCARILWTFATAYYLYGDPADMAMAQRAGAIGRARSCLPRSTADWVMASAQFAGAPAAVDRGDCG